MVRSVRSSVQDNCRVVVASNFWGEWAKKNSRTLNLLALPHFSEHFPSTLLFHPDHSSCRQVPRPSRSWYLLPVFARVVLQGPSRINLTWSFYESASSLTHSFLPSGRRQPRSSAQLPNLSYPDRNDVWHLRLPSVCRVPPLTLAFFRFQFPHARSVNDI